MPVLKTLGYTFFSFCVFLKSYAEDQEKKINTLSKEFMDKNKIPGMSIAIVDKDKIQLYNYGYANDIKKLKTTNNTIYRINSFTKAFTATLAGIGQAEGKLNLSDNFVKYFPEVKENLDINHVTIAELLAHIASLPSAFDPEPNSFKEMVNFLTHFKPPYKIGTRYKYSNYSIGLVGYVVQNAYKKPYEDVLKEKILIPLKLNSTYLNVPKNKENNEALGHDDKNNFIPIRKKIPVLFAAGELKSTISDMAKFLQAQINEENIHNISLTEGINIVHRTKFCFENANLCQQMAWQEHGLTDLEKSTTDVLGDYIVSNNQINLFADKPTFIDKTGGGAGMSSYMAYLTKEQKGVVILINKNLGDERVALGRQILNGF